MKRLLSLLLTSLLLFACAAPAGAVSDGAVSYTKKDVTAYLYDLEHTAVMSCLFRADLPTVPYVPAVDYLNQLYTVAFSCKKNSDGTYTVSDPNGEMIVDVEKDTIHFESFEEFAESDAKPYLETETADYLSDDGEFVVIDGYKAIDLDLAAYGIDLTASGDQVYFPLAVISDIFSCTYHSATYLKDALYFYDVMADEAYYDDSSLFDSVKRDKALVDFSYNELCFVMDHFYGYPPASQLAEPIREKGFDRAISEYDEMTARAKEMLLSEDLVDYCYGLLFLDKYMEDGGHTSLSYGLQLGVDQYPTSAFSEKLMASFYDWKDDRLSKIQSYILGLTSDQEAMHNLYDYREEQFAGLTEVKTWDVAGFYQSGKTGIFSFDSFEDAVVEPFKWSLDYAAENGLENFVVDLSVNGGGSTAVVVYMLSLMSGCSRMDSLNTLTGTQVYWVDIVDRNLDGAFDEKDDALDYDLRFAVLTSRFTFSAANALACLAQDNGVVVLGEASGGGTCALGIHNDPAGYAYAMSDASIMTYPDGRNLDEGATPDYPLPARGKNYLGYYDVAAIEEGIESSYSGRPAPTDAPTEILEPSEPPTQAATDDAGQDQTKVAIWYALIVLTAVLVIVAVILVILIIRRKKQNQSIR